LLLQPCRIREGKMQPHLVTSLTVLSILGIIDSIYLFYKHKRKQPLACPLNTDCNAVMNSKWSTTFGIRNELFGAIYYLIILIGAFVLYYNYISMIHYILIAFSSLALLFSAFLMYLQKYIIKEYCFYCIISAILTFLIFIVILVI